MLYHQKVRQMTRPTTLILLLLLLGTRQVWAWTNDCDDITGKEIKDPADHSRTWHETTVEDKLTRIYYKLDEISHKLDSRQSK